MRVDATCQLFMLDPRCLMDNEGKEVPFRVIPRLFSKEMACAARLRRIERLDDSLMEERKIGSKDIKEN